VLNDCYAGVYVRRPQEHGGVKDDENQDRNVQCVNGFHRRAEVARYYFDQNMYDSAHLSQKQQATTPYSILRQTRHPRG
jgi:hypothetical protein